MAKGFLQRTCDLLQHMWICAENLLMIDAAWGSGGEGRGEGAGREGVREGVGRGRRDEGEGVGRMSEAQKGVT